MVTVRNIAHKAEGTFDNLKFRLKDRFNLFDRVFIYPYYGYGNNREARIKGRILEKERMIHEEQDLKDSIWNNIRKVWKRYESDEIPDVEIEGDFMGIKDRTISNEEGYFELVFQGLNKKKIKDGWYEAQLRIINIPYNFEYREKNNTYVIISNQKNNFGIISDVDDTIIKSRAMNLLKKLRITLTKSSKTRVAFEGVDDLYRILTAKGKNPLFFVSGSSFNLYDMLTSFCEYNNIPKAPFFLRDLGLKPGQWLKQDTGIYKKQYIEHILEFYDKLPFILIGDSGQKDPEIYTDLNEKYPKRIKAIYIRHVHTDKRKKELEDMANQIDVPFLIMENSSGAIKHAEEKGWV